MCLLADNLFTLSHNIKLDTDRQLQLEKTVADLKAKPHYIKAEKVSEAFYHADENFNIAEKNLQSVNSKKKTQVFSAAIMPIWSVY